MSARQSAEALSCFYSLSSPWAYLGGPQLRDIVRRYRCCLRLKPYDFQRIAPTNGGVPLRTRPEPRRSYHALELRRWSDYLGLPLNPAPRYYRSDGQPPDWNKRAGWMVIAAQSELERAHGLGSVVDPVFELSHALLRALWAEERDIADSAVRIAIAIECGFDGERLQSLEASAEVQAVYEANTLEAERFGVFGAPTLVLDGERFWGQDRLVFVERALAKRVSA